MVLFERRMVSSGSVPQGACRLAGGLLLYLTSDISIQDSRSSREKLGLMYEPTCYWDSAEEHLRYADADVLTIMDSSFVAGDISNNDRNRERSFETLTASYDLTRQQGPWSFTRALIHSLKDLRSETAGSTQWSFDTSRLHERIMRHMRNWHKSYRIPPLLNHSMGLSVRHICLAPLERVVPTALNKRVRGPGVLTLQVAFAKRELQIDETTRLARLLAQAAKDADVNITSIDWIDFEIVKPAIHVTVAVSILLRSWIRRWRAQRRERSRARSLNPDQFNDLKYLKRAKYSPESPPVGLRTPPTSRTDFNLPSSAAAQEATRENLNSMVRQQFSEVCDVLNCTLAWNLKSCVDADLEGVSSLNTFLTITGDAFSAYATTCSEWIRRTWGELGMSVLRATCEALEHGTSTSEHLDIHLNDPGDAVELADIVVRHMDVDDAVTVIQTLTWLAATFRPPRDDRLSSSSASLSWKDGSLCISLQALREVEADPLTSCWHSLLGSSVIVGGFYVSNSGRGLELPLPLMLELTGMLYGTALPGSASTESIFYTGVHSILYPTERDDAHGILKWHYTASDCVMTPPVDHAWPHVHKADLDNMRMMLGYTPNVQVNLGTESRSQQYLSMTTSQAQREKDSWSFAWDGFTAQAGFSGSGISLPFKFSRRKGQQGVPTAKPTYDQIIHGTFEKPVILYETACAQETAWLVPQLSVILDLVLLKAYGERSWRDLSASDRAALHARPDWNSGLAALQVLDDYQRANTTLRTSADDGKPIAIKHLVTQVFAAMSHRTQLDQLQPPSSSLITSLLLGWDLIQLTDALIPPTRLQMEISKAGLNNSTPTWLPLAREVPVFFCNGLGDVMTSTVPICSQFKRDQKHLVASIHVLRAKLKKCFKCDEYHIDTRKQLVWQLPRSGCFSACSHGAHGKEDAKAHFDAGIQLMVPANDLRCVKRKLPCPIIPDEGAVIFGAKRLKRGRSSFE